ALVHQGFYFHRLTIPGTTGLNGAPAKHDHKEVQAGFPVSGQRDGLVRQWMFNPHGKTRQFHYDAIPRHILPWNQPQGLALYDGPSTISGPKCGPDFRKYGMVQHYSGLKGSRSWRT